ncbi:MAG: zinc-ribbon domain-containing protein [Nitrospinota bacterium]
MILFLELLVLAIILFIISYPIFKDQGGLKRSNIADRCETDLYDLEILNRSIFDLEYDYLSGKVVKSDYIDLKDNLTNDAKLAVESVKQSCQHLIDNSPVNANYCTDCGAKVGLDHKFCSSCGLAINN